MAGTFNKRGLYQVTDPGLDIVSGDVTGSSVIHKFGRNADIDTTGLPEDVWSGGGVNTKPTEDRIHAIVSSSTEDAGTLVSTGTATSGTNTTLIDTSATFSTDGVAADDIVLLDSTNDHSVVEAVISETELSIHTIHHGTTVENGTTYRIVTSAGTGNAVSHIKLGYQLDGTAVTEFVIMNGTTNVNTTAEFYRINRIHIHGVGSNGTNVGTITATAATDATVTAEIPAGAGQTLMAIFYIPQGFTGYMYNYFVSVYRATKAADAQVEARLMSELWGTHNDGKMTEHITGVSIDGTIHNFNPPKRFAQGTDIWLDVVSATDTDMSVSGGFDIVLVAND